MGNLRPEAESQVRALLQFSDCRINTAVPDAFANLAAVADQLNAARKPDEAPRDGLGCIINSRCTGGQFKALRDGRIRDPHHGRKATAPHKCRNEYFIRTHIYARTGILTRALTTLPTIVVQPFRSFW
jgi:hypothetical protein